MPKPRIMFYTDARHAHIYRYEPPMSKDEYFALIDELVGTSVEAVMLCLGEGRTMLHDTKVGELLGHNVDKWDHAVFRRAHQNAKRLIDEGNDPLRLLCERAHERGMLLYAHLLVQKHGVTEAPVRCSDFRFNNQHLEIGAAGDVDPSFPAFDGLDFKHKEVREERFAIVEEVLTEYPVDGFELQLAQLPYFFHPKKVDAGRKTMTDWVGRVHEAVKRSGPERELVIQVSLSMEECHAVGLDPEQWIRDGIVDVLVGAGDPMGQMTDFRPLLEVTKGTETRVIAPIGNGVGSDRLGGATLSVIRGTATNYWAQGVDGLYLGGWHGDWPYADAFYGKLRELPYPDIMAAKDKFYWVPTSEHESTPLPTKMELNKPAAVKFTITDDLPRWGKADRVHEVLLRIRVLGHTELDRLSFKLNGKELPEDTHRRINELYKQRVPHDRIMGGYWHIFRLGPEHWPVTGENTLEATLLERDPDLVERFCTLRDVELEIKYLMGRSFHRGDGVGLGDVDPDLGPHD